MLKSSLVGLGKKERQYQPSGAGGIRSQLAMPSCLQNPKWLIGGPKMADGVWRGVYPLVFGRSRQPLQYKYFGEKIMSLIVATNVVASRSPERRTPGTPTARANIENVKT